MAIVDDVAIGIQGASHDAQSFRQLLAAVCGLSVGTFTNAIGQTGRAHGTVTSAGLAVTENGTPNMSVDVAAGTALINGDQTLAQGPYACTNNATVNLAIATADATNARKDLVVLRVYDDATDGSGQNEAALEVVTGTPAGSPTDPTIPDNCLILARVDVPALDTAITNSQITDLRVRAFGIGLHPTAYTPTFSATTTPPTLGTGSNLVGSYALDGRRVFGSATVAFGTSGTNAGSGVYTVTIPVAALDSTTLGQRVSTSTGAGHPIGTWNAFDASGGAASGVLQLRSATTVMMRLAATTSITDAVPWTWSTQDRISIVFNYWSAT